MSSRSQSPPRGRRGGSDIEVIALDHSSTAYLLGRQGATKERLANFSGCRLEIGHSKVELIGSPRAIELARLCVQITLQQRAQHRVVPGTEIDYHELEEREDVETLDVELEAVGFLLGAKGATLRQMEVKHSVFMFFDNERVRSNRNGGSTKRLYVIGARRDREAVIDECSEAISFKINGRGAGPRRPHRRSPSPRRYRRSPSPPGRYRRSPSPYSRRSRSRSPYNRYRRSPSPYDR